MEILLLGGNQLESTQGLSPLNSLRVLDIQDNLLHGLTDIRPLTLNLALTHLYLHGNPLSDIPRSRQQCTAILPGLVYLDGVKVPPSSLSQASQAQSYSSMHRIAKSGGVCPPPTFRDALDDIADRDRLEAARENPRVNEIPEDRYTSSKSASRASSRSSKVYRENDSMLCVVRKQSALDFDSDQSLNSETQKSRKTWESKKKIQAGRTSDWPINSKAIPDSNRYTRNEFFEKKSPTERTTSPANVYTSRNSLLGKSAEIKPNKQMDVSTFSPTANTESTLRATPKPDVSIAKSTSNTDKLMDKSSIVPEANTNGQMIQNQANIIENVDSSHKGESIEPRHNKNKSRFKKRQDEAEKRHVRRVSQSLPFAETIEMKASKDYTLGQISQSMLQNHIEQRLILPADISSFLFSHLFQLNMGYY